MTYDERVSIALGLVEYLNDETLRLVANDALLVALALSNAHPEICFPKSQKYNNLRQFPNRRNQKGDDS